VQGVSGNFCSPKCSGSSCPSDVPDGVTAKPQCALRSPTGDSSCALLCTPSSWRGNGANGECGTGTCQAIQGIGLCTYAAADGEAAVATKFLLPSSVPALPALKLETNPTHYGDPAGGCESDEQAVQVQGVSGNFCSPKCSGSSCPSDVPDGVTAKPQCALRSPTGDSSCALLCTPSSWRGNGANGECGTGTCQAIQGVGLCTYASQDYAVAGVTTEIAPLAFGSTDHIVVV